jgi:hypothetical protein
VGSLPRPGAGNVLSMEQQLPLRPMTDAEFTALLARLIPDYAADKVEAGDWAPDEAETLAARVTAELLPAGAGHAAAHRGGR